jgi:hypothetical protein
MLIYDPAGRISAKQALQHEYFMTDDNDMMSPENKPKVFR